MRKRDKARRIRAILDELYPEVQAPLAHADPYSLLVAVLLSAQCTDARVNLITPALFARAPDPEAMVALGQPAIEEIIRSCGLAPTKSRNIHRLSQRLLAEHDGRVPADLKALEALPGVGHKTASVVLSQAFGLPAFPVDTHIFRCARRWGLSRGKDVAQVETDLKALYPKRSWGKLHLQIIFFGREHCPARGHDADSCPICSWTGVSLS